MGLSPRTLRPANNFTPRSITGLALWLDASSPETLYTTDAGAVTPVSSPTDIAGCALWLDGADSSAASMTLNGSLVETWKDKSGSGRNATASGTARPTLTPNAQNGRSALTFDGSATQMQIDSTFLVTSNATIFAVARRTSGSFGAVITSKGTGDTSPALQHSSGAWQINHAGNLSIIGTTAGYAVLSGTISAGATAAYANGLIQDSDASSGTLSSDATKTYIGTYRAAVANVLAGDIAEIVVFNTALSTADRARVEAYLAAKWGISGVHAPATATSDPVGAWLDKSGNARHATQSTAGSRPTISANTQGGKKMLGFDGANGRLTISFPVTAADPVSMIAVARRGATTWGGGGGGGYGSFLNSTGGSSGGPQLRVDTGNIEVIGGTNKSTTLGSNVGVGSCAIIEGMVSSLATSLYVQGALVDSDAGAGSITTSGTRTSIGAWNDGTQGGGPLNGDIAELICYRASLSTSQRQKLERYLAAKWGITLAPQVSNADAKNWIDRVYANGGTVSASTAAAVNTLCIDLENASLRDRFYRLNLFCGTGLNAALVPLYRGPSLGGTQYGGATDTNAGGLFVSGDYSESAGLTANLSSTKYLDTGLQTSALPAGVIDSGHLSAWHGAISAADTDPYFVAANNGSLDRAAIQVGVRTALASVESCRYGKTTNVNASAGVTGARPAAFLLGQRTSATNLELWKNNSVVGTNTTSSTGIAGIPYNFYVFAANNAGTRIGDQPGTTLRHYSIGDDMTPSQVGAFYNALSAFNASMGRV